jgi:hypothetical protein
MLEAEFESFAKENLLKKMRLQPPLYDNLLRLDRSVETVMPPNETAKWLKPPLVTTEGQSCKGPE